MQSESVNNVCKLLQLLEDKVHQTPYRGFGVTGGLRSSRSPELKPQNENSLHRH